jgi:hypothetical protein
MGKIRHVSRETKKAAAACAAEKEKLLQEALQNKSHKQQKLATLFEAIKDKNTVSNNKAQHNKSLANKEAGAKIGNRNAKMLQLLDTLQSKSKQRILHSFKALILQIEKNKCQELLATDTYLEAFYCMAFFSNQFVREISSWKPKSHNTAKQFSSLVKHLFAKYHTPSFLETAWLEREKNLGNENVNSWEWTHKQWYLAIANGSSVRSLTDLPPNFTKRMMHEFLQAPNYITVHEALRYAQVKGFGGDERLAWYVNQTFLGRNQFLNDAFWQTVIQFFANVEMFDYEQLGAIFDYIQSQKFGQNYTNHLYQENGHRGVAVQPAQPNFEMKGRTADNLLRQTLAWHNELNKTSRRFLAWKKSTIRDFVFTEGTAHNEQTYCFVELLNTKALFEEGNAMKHCVASYDQSCVNGRSAIFSLSIANSSQDLRLATIEVNLQNNQIVQLKGKLNTAVGVKVMEMVSRWATMENLSVSKWL